MITCDRSGILLPPRVCRFSHFYAEYGGLNFMLTPNSRELANDCLVQILEGVYLGTLQFQ